MSTAWAASAILDGMHDLVLDAAAALLALLAAVTFAAMIWAARQVDGRSHAAPRLRLPHLRRHA